MLGLAERMNKKSGPGKFYKKTAENISYFNKKLFTIRNKKKIDNNSYYWLKKTTKTNQYLLKRFQRNEIFSVVNNFVM